MRRIKVKRGEFQETRKGTKDPLERDLIHILNSCCTYYLDCDFCKMRTPDKYNQCHTLWENIKFPQQRIKPEVHKEYAILFEKLMGDGKGR